MWPLEIAETLGMPLSELGQRMSRYELEVIWPAYFEAKARRVARAEREAEKGG